LLQPFTDKPHSGPSLHPTLQNQPTFSNLWYSAGENGIYFSGTQFSGPVIAEALTGMGDLHKRGSG
jgi:hypothetical protein